MHYFNLNKHENTFFDRAPTGPTTATYNATSDSVAGFKVKVKIVGKGSCKGDGEGEKERKKGRKERGRKDWRAGSATAAI